MQRSFNLVFTQYYHRNQATEMQTIIRTTYSDVEAEQVTDHSRHGRQNDHFGDVINQRVYGETKQSEWSIQLLVEAREKPYCNPTI